MLSCSVDEKPLDVDSYQGFGFSAADLFNSPNLIVTD